MTKPPTWKNCEGEWIALQDHNQTITTLTNEITSNLDDIETEIMEYIQNIRTLLK